jgi:hypothetical protein
MNLRKQLLFTDYEKACASCFKTPYFQIFGSISIRTLATYANFSNHSLPNLRKVSNKYFQYDPLQFLKNLFVNWLIKTQLIYS